MSSLTSAQSEAGALIAAAGAMALALTCAQAQQLLHLLDELQRWNRAYNLTAIKGRAAMIGQHLLDSLSAHADLAGDRIADVGTGAGFPGLPLAVIYPQRHFTLIDATAKKIRFVAHAAHALGLNNVTPLCARVEALRVDPFETVIARAFAPLPKMLAQVRAACDAGTRVLALKGRYPAEEIAQLPKFWQLQSARAVSIPGLHAERHILTLALAR